MNEAARDRIVGRFDFHRAEVMHVKQQIDDILSGVIRFEAVNQELNVLSGHLAQIEERLNQTESIVIEALSQG